MTSTPQPDAATDRSSRRAAVFVRRAASEVRGLRSDQGRSRLLAAATALGVVLVARFALGLAALVGSALGYSVTPWPSDFTATPVGQFLGSFVLYPFPFYLVAFVVLLLVRPVDAGLSLPRALRHGRRRRRRGHRRPGARRHRAGRGGVAERRHLGQPRALPHDHPLRRRRRRHGAAARRRGARLARVPYGGAPGRPGRRGRPASPAATRGPPPTRSSPPAPGCRGGAGRPPGRRVHDPAREPAPATRPTPPRSASAADDWSRFAPPAAADGDDR